MGLSKTAYIETHFSLLITCVVDYHTHLPCWVFCIVEWGARNLYSIVNLQPAGYGDLYFGEVGKHTHCQHKKTVFVFDYSVLGLFEDNSMT